MTQVRPKVNEIVVIKCQSASLIAYKKMDGFRFLAQDLCY